MKSAFLPFDERLAVINEIIKPGYGVLQAEQAIAAIRSVPS
jgi:hypothetical protein